MFGMFTNLRRFILNMASATSNSNQDKRKAEEVDKVGYIHNVSPMKRSRTNHDYFNSTLQIGPNAYTNILGFNKKHLAQLKEAAQHKSPVKINKAALVPNLKESNKMDIKIQYPTQISTHPTALSFKYKQPQEEKSLTMPTIKDIKTHQATERQKLNVTGRITKVLEEESIQSVFGTDLAKKVFALADEEETIAIALYSTLIPTVELDKTYSFKNVSIRQNNDTKTLTTTPTTEITPADDIIACDKLPKCENVSHLLLATCQQIEVSSSKSCSSCKKNLPNPNILQAKTFKCPNCNMRQITELVTNHIKAKMNIKDNGNIYRLTAFSDLLTNFLKANFINLDSIEDMEVFFLELPPFHLSYNSATMAVTYMATH
ncbi:uncharacterized protein LOC135493490 isoform X1 [Lineus longissimus]|uniref:uncharacterized protein LOC135493490 isoform X1 n=2 Tax=Lineus longissimus TaxID=88925 RepID=UPI00315C692A